MKELAFFKHGLSKKASLYQQTELEKIKIK